MDSYTCLGYPEKPTSKSFSHQWDNRSC